MTTEPKTTGLTYEDLRSFPDDNLRREIIDGELFVTPSPIRRHQRVVVELVAALRNYEKQHGGEVYPAPMDVLFDDVNVVEPDVLFLRPERLPGTDDQKIVEVPDLVIEVSSPSTRRTDLIRKRDLYERFGVAEYWFVDIEAERLEVYRLHEGRYGRPDILQAGDVLTTELLPDFTLDLSTILESPTAQPEGSP
jgi:Uma2 family endonuclease